MADVAGQQQKAVPTTMVFLPSCPTRVGHWRGLGFEDMDLGALADLCVDFPVTLFKDTVPLFIRLPLPDDDAGPQFPSPPGPPQIPSPPAHPAPQLAFDGPAVDQGDDLDASRSATPEEGMLL